VEDNNKTNLEGKDCEVANWLNQLKIGSNGEVL
jgi:hypothetical protein